jgi:hypothetical protein
MSSTSNSSETHESLLSSVRKGAGIAFKETCKEFKEFADDVKAELVPQSTPTFQETASKAQTLLGGCIHVPYFPAFHRYGNC